MKRINKKQSTQTDGSGGAKMSVKDQAEISMHIDIKKRIGNLEGRLHELRQLQNHLIRMMYRALLTWRFVIPSRNLVRNMQNLAFQ